MNLEKWFCTPIWYDYTQFDFAYIKQQCLLLAEHYPNRVYTNVGGWQSNDLYLHNHPEFREIKDIIDDRINVFAKDIGKNLRLKLDNCWLNLNYKGNSNSKHIHPKTLFSGVLYISTNEQSGDLIFYNDAVIEHYPLIEGDDSSLIYRTVTYYPKNGMIVMFPSWSSHSVTPNKSDEVRISLAFNVTNE